MNAGREEIHQLRVELEEEIEKLKAELERENIRSLDKEAELVVCKKSIEELTEQKDVLRRQSTRDFEQLSLEKTQLCTLLKETSTRMELMKRDLRVRERKINELQSQLDKLQTVARDVKAGLNEEEDTEIPTEHQGKLMLEYEKSQSLQQNQDPDKLFQKYSNIIPEKDKAIDRSRNETKMELRVCSKCGRFEQELSTCMSDQDVHTKQQLSTCMSDQDVHTKQELSTCMSDQDVHTKQELSTCMSDQDVHTARKRMLQLERELAKPQQSKTKLTDSISYLQEEHNDMTCIEEARLESIELLSKNLQLEMKVLEKRIKHEAKGWRVQFQKLISSKISITKQLEEAKIQINGLSNVIHELEEGIAEKVETSRLLKDTIKELVCNERRSVSAYNELLAAKEFADAELNDLKGKYSDITTSQAGVVKENEVLQQKIIEQEKTIADLKAYLVEIKCEKEKLEIQGHELQTEAKALKENLQEAAQLAGQVPVIKALLSKKESSKAILTAEQQKQNKEYQLALSQKCYKINDLESEIRLLQKQTTLTRENEEIHGENSLCVDKFSDKSTLFPETDDNRDILSNGMDTVICGDRKSESRSLDFSRFEFNERQGNIKPALQTSLPGLQVKNSRQESQHLHENQTIDDITVREQKRSHTTSEIRSEVGVETVQSCPAGINRSTDDCCSVKTMERDTTWQLDSNEILENVNGAQTNLPSKVESRGSNDSIKDQLLKSTRDRMLSISERMGHMRQTALARNEERTNPTNECISFVYCRSCGANTQSNDTLWRETKFHGNSSDDLGSRIAELTNELTARKWQADVIQLKLDRQKEENSRLKEVANMLSCDKEKLDRLTLEQKDHLRNEKRLLGKNNELKRRVSTLRHQLEAASNTNKTLESYIFNLRQSYTQLFEDAE